MFSKLRNDPLIIVVIGSFFMIVIVASMLVFSPKGKLLNADIENLKNSFQQKKVGPYTGQTLTIETKKADVTNDFGFDFEVPPAYTLQNKEVNADGTIYIIKYSTSTGKELVAAAKRNPRAEEINSYNERNPDGGVNINGRIWLKFLLKPAATEKDNEIWRLQTTNNQILYTVTINEPYAIVLTFLNKFQFK